MEQHVSSIAAGVSPEELDLGALFWRVPDALAVVDVERGQIALWNPAAEALFGYAAAEAVGMPVESLFPERCRLAYRAVQERCRAAARDGRAPGPMELSALHRSGAELQVEVTLCWVEARAIRRELVLAIIRDVTKRKRAEDANRWMAAVVESTHDGIIGTTMDGTITSWNRGAERLYGYSAKEAIGRSIQLVIPPERHDELRRIFDRLRRGERIRDFETVRVRKDGSRVDVSLTISPIRNASGTITGAASIARDIREKKAAEAERAERIRADIARAEAEAGLRLRDEFLSTVAHELKTPVTAIRGYAQLLLKRGSADPQTARVLKVLDRQSSRLALLIEDMLELSRLGLRGRAQPRQRFDLAGLAKETVDQLQTTAERHRLLLERAETAVVEADREAIEQVLLHLLHNAIKYSPAGGDVMVRVGAEGGEAIVSVRDQGIGIPKERQAQVFQRFYRAHAGTPQDYGGMGIGLYLSREMVAWHGGRMWFESEPGKGSTFSFSLPLARGQGGGR